MNISHSLPWQHYSKQLADMSTHWQAWLLYSGSFMTRLRQCGVTNLRVHVLQESWQTPFFQENERLNRGSQEDALVREVLILSEEAVWMYARTILPRETIKKQSQLAHLQDKSLGSILFNDPTVSRGEFEIVKLQSHMDWYKKIAQYVNLTADALWARRSVFHLRGHSLLLTEVFMPDIEKLC